MPAKQSTIDILGPRIRAERQARGLTMRQLADKAGVAHRTIHNVEFSEAGTQFLNILDALAEALDMDVSELVSP